MKRDPEITEIQSKWFETYGEHKKWIIVEVPEGYQLHIHDYDNVSPVITYPNKRAVVSRLLQLFHIGPVAPQTEPEQVMIGQVYAIAEEEPPA